MNVQVKAAGRTFSVPSGMPLARALNQHEPFVETPCGARGQCRKCLVRVLGEAPEPTPADLEQLTPAELAQGFRLSCQLRVDRDLEVAVVPAVTLDPRKARLGALAGPAEVDPWAPLNPTGRSLGFALDVGTTGIAGALLDLRTGEELAVHASLNPQAVYGADLMTRLSHAIQGEEQKGELTRLVRDAAQALLGRLLGKAGARPEEVTAASLVGNTAMHHLFLGLPVEQLAVAPYTPAVTEGRVFEVPGFPALYALPVIAGFVGADTVAAALAAGLDAGEETVLLVDVGTNGEVLLRHAGRLYACSAPAGPAFEGGEISQGMRAGPGAIEAVRFDGRDLVVTVIPGGPRSTAGGGGGSGTEAARGICGSGLLDAAAALLEAGLMDETGRLTHAGPAAHRLAEGGRAVALAPGVQLTQKDLRSLQLAKGAIRSGIEVLLRVAGIGPARLDKVLLAGAFGNYLRRESAVATGLLPPVDPGRIQPIGNAAIAGAKLALLSRSARDRAEALARGARFVELATHPDFEEVFMEALNFPRVRPGA
ncbi:ASKHA domain-containing protein [Symbiobacterium thermophilum]|uniref:ASKHA domain-containing protein n=1 Tax=Symbiobacterium thermophilum TaxID=2734 RepID=UPI00031EBAB3|nr:ASKHA domain-containing protein [Symbiobacterium thermophilum]